MQKEIKHELYAQYLDFHVSEARNKAQREFDVIDEVRTHWAGMNVEVMVFSYEYIYKCAC